MVRNFFADMKRHDLGPKFHERNYDGTLTTQFMTEPLWVLVPVRRTAMTAAASICAR